VSFVEALPPSLAVSGAMTERLGPSDHSAATWVSIAGIACGTAGGTRAGLLLVAC
jgi:hypothetical protein